MILPVDRNAGNCLVKGSTCAPLLTFVPLRDLPQEPAKKQSGAAAADRTPTLKSVTEPPKILREKLRTPGTVQCSLSQRTQVLTSVKKYSKTRVPQKFVRIPYIPVHFLSPDSYTSGHVARIQLYTCHHLERPLLERHFLLFRLFD